MPALMAEGDKGLPRSAEWQLKIGNEKSGRRHCVPRLPLRLCSSSLADLEAIRKKQSGH